MKPRCSSHGDTSRRWHALEEDQLAPVLRPVVDILEKAFRNTLLEPLVPTGYQDWLGCDIKRPLNMPVDQLLSPRLASPRTRWMTGWRSMALARSHVLIATASSFVQKVSWHRSPASRQTNDDEGG